MGSPSASTLPEGKLSDVLREEVAELTRDVQAQRHALPPLWEKCKEAVAALDKHDFHELKSLIKPPPLIALVADAVALLLTGHTGWWLAQRLLADPHLLPALAAFDPGRVPLRIRLDLRGRVQHPQFRPEVVRWISRACEGLCRWVLAVDRCCQAEHVLRSLEALLVAKEEELAGHAPAPREAIAPSPILSTPLTSLSPSVDNVVALQAEIGRCQAELQVEHRRISSARETCRACLRKLKKSHVQELKSMPNPPPAVAITLEAVAFLLTGRTGWEEVKRLLSCGSLREQLAAFNQDTVPRYVFEGLQWLLEDRAFTPEVVGRAHPGCRVLCTWLRAVSTYVGASRAVAVLRGRLAARRQELQSLAGLAHPDSEEVDDTNAMPEVAPALPTSPSPSNASTTQSSCSSKVLKAPSVTSRTSIPSTASSRSNRLSLVTCWDGTRPDCEGVDVFVAPGNTVEEVVSKCVRVCNFSAGPAELLSLFGEKMEDISYLQDIGHVLLLPRGERYRRRATPTAVRQWLRRVDPRPRPAAMQC